MYTNTQKLQTICLNLKKYYSQISLEFVPKHEPILETDVELLRSFIRDHNKLFVVTGAGISTESGIPDYRSEEVGLYARSNHKPIQYLAFLNSSATRRRYWARNYIGWPRFSQRKPNTTHYTLKEFQDCDKITTILTQNVDNLHQKAGSKDVIELHGTSYKIRCLGCDDIISRHDFQGILAGLNPCMKETEQQTKMIRPDGDVEIPEEIISNFNVPTCSTCNGIYKPDIIFFGDNVPRQRVELIKKKVEESDSLLVLGSSLTVFSSYRILLQASDLNLPIVIVNIGSTRADHLALLKVSGKCGEILPRIYKSLF